MIVILDRGYGANKYARNRHLLELRAVEKSLVRLDTELKKEKVCNIKNNAYLIRICLMPRININVISTIKQVTNLRDTPCISNQSSDRPSSVPHLNPDYLNRVNDNVWYPVSAGDTDHSKGNKIRDWNSRNNNNNKKKRMRN